MSEVIEEETKAFKTGKQYGTTKSKGAARTVKFVYRGEARKVCVAGEFNNWNRESLPMTRGKDSIRPGLKGSHREGMSTTLSSTDNGSKIPHARKRG